jgi:hypothetical protein
VSVNNRLPRKPSNSISLAVLSAREAPLLPDEGDAFAPTLVPERPDPIVGLRLKLDRKCDCQHGCCNLVGIKTAGKGPHRYGLECADCGTHRGWLKAAAADLLRTLHDLDHLSSLPTLRDHGVIP